MISLTDRALKMALQLAEDNELYRGLPLRVYIEGKGCDGFYYGVSFDPKNESDISFIQNEIEIIIDPDSLMFMKDSTVDFVNDERGTGFVVNNPNHKKFRGKFYKKSVWKYHLEQKANKTTFSQ